MQTMQIEERNQTPQYHSKLDTQCQQYHMYSVTCQAQTLGPGQTNVNYQFSNSVTGPIKGQTGQGNHGSSYPVLYNQQEAMVAPTKTYKLNTVQNQPSTPKPVRRGFAYDGQHRTASQINQNTIAHGNTFVTQSISLDNNNTLSAVNIARQQPPGFVQGSAATGSTVPARNTPYTSPPKTSYPTMNPAQQFHSEYTPKKQMPMQNYYPQPQVQQQQQQQQHRTMVSAVSKTTQTSPQHVSGTTQRFSTKTSPAVGKVEHVSGRRSQHPVNVQMTNTSFRFHAQNQDTRPQHQSLRAQVQSVPSPQQQQSLTNRFTTSAITLLGPTLTAKNIDEFLCCRGHTLHVLDDVVQELRKFGKNEKMMNLVSTGGSIVSGVAATILLLAAPASGGTSAVVGGAIVSGLGTVSGVLSLGSKVITYLKERDLLELAQKALEMDARISRKLEKIHKRCLHCIFLIQKYDRICHQNKGARPAGKGKPNTQMRGGHGY